MPASSWRPSWIKRKARLISDVTDHWGILGIAPTADEDAIRRAYAVRVKQTKSDPQAFMAVRAAYEAILRGQGGHQAKPQPQRRTIPLSGVVPPDLFGNALVEALGQSDPAHTRDFLQMYLTPTLPLQITTAYEVEAIRRVAETPNLSLAHLQVVQNGFGWGGITHPLAKSEPQVYALFLKRVSAASLHAKLVADAGFAHWLKIPASHRIAARLVLARPLMLPIRMYDGSILRLAKSYAEIARVDQPWSDYYFNSERINRLLKPVKRPTRLRQIGITVGTALGLMGVLNSSDWLEHHVGIPNVANLIAAIFLFYLPAFFVWACLSRFARWFANRRKS